MKRLVALVFLISFFLPTVVHAQSQQGDYGTRLQSKDGRWLLPVATRINGSDEEKHTGRGSVLAWDLVAPLNTPVYAMGPGKVVYAGCNNSGGYGCWLFIDHSEFKAVYGHMVEGSIKVKAGQTVDANTVIGLVGRTGMTSFGPHTHLEMQKPGGGRFRIDQWFDRSGMRFCSLCSVSGEPAVWQGDTRRVVQNVQVPTQPVAAAPAQSLNEEYMQIIGLLLAIIAFILLSWVFGKDANTVRNAAAIAVAVTMPLWAPVWFMLAGAGQVQAANTVPSAETTMNTALGAAPGGAWEYAYKFASKWEGEECTEDGAHTYAGVTQGAWDRFTSRHGLPKTDVCATKPDSKVRGAIFYEDYWVKSGADKLPALLGIAHADFAYNVGPGSTGAAAKTLAKCGTDINCYMAERLRWYTRECRNCAEGHARRTKDMVKFLNSLIQ